jgi:hypothetical protein
MYASVCESRRRENLGWAGFDCFSGQKKEQENQLMKKKRKEPLSEDAAIASALEEAKATGVADGIPVFGASDEDLELDALLAPMAANDEMIYDGIFWSESQSYEYGWYNRE